MTRRTLIYFISALLFALASLIGYVVWFLAFSSAKESALTAVAEVSRIEKEDTAIANAQDTITTLEADEALLRSYFVSEKDIVPFLEELESSGEVHESSVEVVSVVQPDSGAERLRVALRVEGSFPAVMRTLGSIEHGPRDMRVESVTIETVTSGEVSSWTAVATFSVASLRDTP